MSGVSLGRRSKDRTLAKKIGVEVALDRDQVPEGGCLTCAPLYLAQYRQSSVLAVGGCFCNLCIAVEALSRHVRGCTDRKPKTHTLLLLSTHLRMCHAVLQLCSQQDVH